MFQITEAKSNYIFDVEKEKQRPESEDILIPDLDSLKPPLKNYIPYIVPESLSTDLVSRFQRRFGFSEGQINFQTQNRFEEFTSFDGTIVTVEEDVKRKRKYAEFMVRKISEHHVDSYLKKNKRTRGIYKIKKSLSNASISIKGGLKLRAKYSISGNSLKLRVKNFKNIRNELVIDFDPELGNKDQAVILHIGIPFYYKTKFDNYFDLSLNDLTTVIAKNYETLGVSVTNVVSVDRGSENNKIILGLNWTY